MENFNFSNDFNYNGGGFYFNELDSLAKPKYKEIYDECGNLIEKVIYRNGAISETQKDKSEIEESVVHTEKEVKVEDKIETKDEIKVEEVGQVDCNLFGTTQIKIPVPTKDFITDKSTDVRVYLAINAMSNVDDCTQVGSNVRYTSLRKYNNNKKEMKEYTGLSDKQINRHLNKLLVKNSKELQLVKKEYNGEVVDCYQMKYEAGGFVTIPVDVVKKMLIKLGNVPIKLYLTLLWICADKENSGYKETLVTQKYILEKMGYSARSTDTIKIATDALIETKMIRTRDVMSSKTEVKDGKVINSTPKTEKYYTILI